MNLTIIKQNIFFILGFKMKIYFIEIKIFLGSFFKNLVFELISSIINK